MATSNFAYPETTESMQAGPEVPHRREVTSESSPPPLPQANCTGHTAIEWIPDHEPLAVPPEVAALCNSCPIRQACLTAALDADERGYWAGTTTRTRRNLQAVGQTSIATADWLQSRDQGDVDEHATHAPGEGSLNHYRRNGCRCHECRAANTAARGRERAARQERTRTTAAHSRPVDCTTRDA